MNRHFNLQPWRANKAESNKKQFYIIIACIVLMILLCGFLYKKYLDSVIQEQNQAINYLNQQMTTIDSAKKEIDRIKKINDDVELQIKTVEGLRAQKTIVTDILSFFAKELSDSIFLDALTYQNKTLTLQGVAKNEGDISELIRKMEANPMFLGVNLVYIRDAVDSFRYKVNPQNDVSAKVFEITAPIMDVTHASEAKK